MPGETLCRNSRMFFFFFHLYGNMLADLENLTLAELIPLLRISSDEVNIKRII